ncbi:hypothetical protein JB92DRAFT_2804600 [Gautieria morchelliformis]|nr:hypothetical protein JB92DRAFT_2804600 [Gautieria morchelliformis]
MVLVWVVTGCSTGFGKEICISALKKDNKVIATCRGDADSRLSDLVAQGATALSLDVAAPFDDIQAFAQKAIGVYGQVDIVCNNAGYVQMGAFEEIS